MKKKAIKITIELTEEATRAEATHIAEAVLTGIADYEPEHDAGGDLRSLVKNYGFIVQAESWPE